MHSTADLSIADYQALAEIRYQIRRFLHFSEQAAREAGLVPQQHQLLLVLKGLPAGRKATISEVAERLQLQHHSTVELIDRLVERGLIKRLRDETDQRRVIIQLTPQAEQVLRRAFAPSSSRAPIGRTRLRSCARSASCRQHRYG